MSRIVPTRARESLEERTQRLDVKRKSCSDCPLYVPSPTGLAFGWCKAHEQYVKLAHGSFWSQCQFKALSRAAPEPAGETA